MQSCFFYWPSDPEENLRRFPQKDGWFTKICSQVQDLFWISLEAHFPSFLEFFGHISYYCKGLSMIFHFAGFAKDARCYSWISSGLRFSLSCFCIPFSYCLSIIVGINPKWVQLTLNWKRIRTRIWFHAPKKRFRGIPSCTRGEESTSRNDYKVLQFHDRLRERHRKSMAFPLIRTFVRIYFTRSWQTGHNYLYILSNFKGNKLAYFLSLL